MNSNSSGVYRIRNMLNGHIYIGSSVNVYKRKKNHVNMLHKSCHHSIHLQRAVDKYGIRNFRFKVLLYCDPNMLLYYEQACMDKFKPEYNINPNAINSLGVKRSDEYRRQMSESHKGISGYWTGKVLSEETRYKLSVAHKGVKLSEETRRKMSDSLVGNQHTKGYKHSDETRHKISEALKNRKLSEEHKHKLSELHKGHVFSAESRRKMSDANKGRKSSEETKRKISEAGKARWERYRHENAI